MTDDWIREQIQKVCGIIGDPMKDLNVVEEAERFLVNKGKESMYIEQLVEICRPNGSEPDSIDDLLNAIRANARQRSKAVYATIQKIRNSNAATKRP